ncbi:MAG: hypothetical protein WC711_01515 [Candidatus Staskawiczbacteria bacterium]|jgi:hypothetical protein
MKASLLKLFRALLQALHGFFCGHTFAISSNTCNTCGVELCGKRLIEGFSFACNLPKGHKGQCENTFGQDAISSYLRVNGGGPKINDSRVTHETTNS